MASGQEIEQERKKERKLVSIMIIVNSGMKSILEFLFSRRNGVSNDSTRKTVSLLENQSQVMKKSRE